MTVPAGLRDRTKKMISVLYRPRVIIGVVIWYASLILYTVTMAPDVLAHDPGEWQAAGFTLGIAHAPGSPAYIIIAKLFTLLPFGLPATRVTFVSVVMGATGVVSTYAFMLLLFNRLLPALVSAATLAVAAIWWGQSVVATPYNAVPTMMATLLILLLLWSRSGNVRLLWGGALLAGLGLAYHPLLMFFLPVLLAGIFLLGPWRTLLKPGPLLILVLMLMAGLSVYLYLPICSAADPPILYQKIDSLSTFYNFVSASHARETKLRDSILPGLSEVGERLDEVVYQSYYPFSAYLMIGPVIVLLLPAVWTRLRRLRRWLLFLVMGMVVHIFTIFVLSDIYNHYYLPMLFYFAIWAGFAAYLIITICEVYISRKWLKQFSVLATGAFYITVLALGLSNTWVFANHGGDRGMREYINTVFRQARPGAVVLANWESYTGLLYAQKIEGQRPDVSLYSVPVPIPKELWFSIKAEHPSSQVLIARSFNVMNESDAKLYGAWQPLSIKGGTYQDFKHGKPYPVAAKVFDERTEAEKYLASNQE